MFFCVQEAGCVGDSVPVSRISASWAKVLSGSLQVRPERMYCVNNLYLCLALGLNA